MPRDEEAPVALRVPRRRECRRRRQFVGVEEGVEDLGDAVVRDEGAAAQCFGRAAAPPQQSRGAPSNEEARRVLLLELRGRSPAERAHRKVPDPRERRLGERGARRGRREREEQPPRDDDDRAADGGEELKGGHLGHDEPRDAVGDVEPVRGPHARPQVARVEPELDHAVGRRVGRDPHLARRHQLGARDAVDAQLARAEREPRGERRPRHFRVVADLD
mmetsp:Transcript_3267/g.12541  ORF Transcript_3267/g.12541 Transcript_3267/m.12541 type:complete len:219 (+) Transcript_3267:1787-2443(+)